MHLEGGGTVDLETMNVRITEFTVGPDGPKAMPGPLPKESLYTYAFEINADEAIAAHAPSITFSTPLIYYVDNFLRFPAGTTIPLGSFSRDGETVESCGAASAWIASDSGVALDVVGESSGAAQVDVTGMA